jgi:hypothetical protein
MYSCLESLYTLFEKYNFYLKNKEIQRNQFKLEFIKMDNPIDIFSITKIDNKFNILIPFKNMNTSFKTSISSLDNLYSFLELHLYNYNNK